MYDKYVSITLSCDFGKTLLPFSFVRVRGNYKYYGCDTPIHFGKKTMSHRAHIAINIYKKDFLCIRNHDHNNNSNDNHNVVVLMTFL